MQYGYILKHLRPKKLLKTIKMFLYAGISQGGITARTLTLMQGFEGKKKNTPRSFLISDMPLRSSQIEPHRDNGQMHASTTTLPRNWLSCIKVLYSSRKSCKKVSNFFRTLSKSFEIWFVSINKIINLKGCEVGRSMTNYPKPASEPNATQILNKFILKHLRPKKVQCSKKKYRLVMTSP